MNEIIRLPFFDEKHITRDEITSYYLWDIEKFQLSKEKGIELFFSFFASEQYYNTQMVEGSLEKLKMFKINGYKLVVVTARDEQFKDRTIEWVERHYP
ncbi:hypothetical protein IJU97_06565 [bacterium]|nr:hypothetical protein [bacterium]